MKFTISDCLSRINQALNYPAIFYEDVSHFFDQAIAELNTSLRIALPTVTEMRLENTFKLSEAPNTVVVDSEYVTNALPTAENDSGVYYRVGDSLIENCFYIRKNGVWTPVDSVNAITKNGKGYTAIAVDSYAVWREIPIESVKEFSLTNYLTTDWIILFLIPYVCFKFAVRNGDNGALFSDEFTQGFQQLQTSYNVPNEIALNTVAHLPAYREIVKENITALNKKVFTRAITPEMRVTNAIKVVYGDNLFDKGGWDI